LAPWPGDRRSRRGKGRWCGRHVGGPERCRGRTGAGPCSPACCYRGRTHCDQRIHGTAGLLPANRVLIFGCLCSLAARSLENNGSTSRPCGHLLCLQRPDAQYRKLDTRVLLHPVGTSATPPAWAHQKWIAALS
jgi:hypothetical protein